MSLDRFHSAQQDRFAGYEAALSEIRCGGKAGRWIWYIFPQLAGFGRSSTARTYALRDLEEAREYLRDPVLCRRYEEIAGAVFEQMTRGVSLETLMGSRIDVVKLVSSLTLFRAAALGLTITDDGRRNLAQRSDALLDRAAKQGYPPCAHTLARLAG